MKYTYPEQRAAVKEAIKRVTMVLDENPDDVTKNYLSDQLDALREVLTNLDKLENLSRLLKSI